MRRAHLDRIDRPLQVALSVWSYHYGPDGATKQDTVFILRPDQQARVASFPARGADGKLSPIEFAMPQAPCKARPA